MTTMNRKSLLALIVIAATVVSVSRAEAQTPAVSGRNRIDLKAGMATSSVLGGLQFTHYFTERVSMFVAAEGIQPRTGTTAVREGFGTVSAVAIPIGVRWNPIRSQGVPPGIRPYVATALVSVIGSSNGSFGGGASAGAGVNVSATAGAQLGGGVDFQVSRRIVISIGAAYNWLAPFDGPAGSNRHFSGPEVGVGFGVLFGSGR
jgi:outer membrane protein W